MKLTSRVKRTIRTVIQVVLAVATAVPTLLAHAPESAVLAQVVVACGVVTHYFAWIEALPVFPSWLRVPTPSATSLPSSAA